MSEDVKLLSLEELEELELGFCPEHRNSRYCPDMCGERNVLAPDRLIATAKAAHKETLHRALKTVDSYKAEQEAANLRADNERLSRVVEAARVMGCKFCAEGWRLENGWHAHPMGWHSCIKAEIDALDAAHTEDE